MSTFYHVDPETLSVPPFGRGAWSREGISFDYRYTINPINQPRIGTQCEKSVAHWAVGAGAWAIQARLIARGFLAPLVEGERGMWGPKTDQAFRTFQERSSDPMTKLLLEVDGFCGRQDARALWTPLIDGAETKYKIPGHILRGQLWWESWLDPGCVGWSTLYGIDRGLAAINSKWRSDVTWNRAFDPTFAIPYTANSLAVQREKFESSFGGKQLDRTLWDATIAYHNNPEKALEWARTGVAPDEQIFGYVKGVRSSIY